VYVIHLLLCKQKIKKLFIFNDTMVQSLLFHKLSQVLFFPFLRGSSNDSCMCLCNTQVGWMVWEPFGEKQIGRNTKETEKKKKCSVLLPCTARACTVGDADAGGRGSAVQGHCERRNAEANYSFAADGRQREVRRNCRPKSRMTAKTWNPQSTNFDDDLFDLLGDTGVKANHRRVYAICTYESVRPLFIFYGPPRVPR
jgi:hypothetical protein